MTNLLKEQDSLDLIKMGMIAPSETSSVDLVKLGLITPAQDQGDCKASSAFAAIAAIEGRNSLMSHELVKFSEQYLIDCQGTLNVCQNDSTVQGCKLFS